MPTALLSVHDKTGLVGLGKDLSSLGWKLLATGGTLRTLQEAGLEVTDAQTRLARARDQAARNRAGVRP